MGLNVHTVQFRPQLYRDIASLARDYHPVEWDLGNDSDFATAFPSARNGVNWRQVYGSWRAAGWRVDASLMFETIPRERWKNLAQDAGAYAERLARALGPSSPDPLLEAVEIGNEPGKFSDTDYRLILENMARGFKKGDSRLRVVTGALTIGKSHDYAKSVECLAGLNELYDVLNLHTYAQLEGWPTWRRSYPEDPKLKEYLPDIRRLCTWRDEHAPGKEVWVTEFGYDASSRSPDLKTEFKQWVGVSEEQQAQWIVRSWLLFATLPVERAYLYFFNDDDEPHVHGSSGLTRHFQPKPAFYAAAHLHRTLGDYRFERVLVAQPGAAYLFEFTHSSDASRRIWVAWSPTAGGQTANLDLPPSSATIERAERMPLGPEPAGHVEVVSSSTQIPVTESPLYLFVRLPTTGQ
jgi:serine/threonine-protein kinase ATR